MEYKSQPGHIVKIDAKINKISTLLTARLQGCFSVNFSDNEGHIFNLLIKGKNPLLKKIKEAMKNQKTIQIIAIYQRYIAPYTDWSEPSNELIEI